MRGIVLFRQRFQWDVRMPTLSWAEMTTDPGPASPGTSDVRLRVVPEISLVNCIRIQRQVGQSSDISNTDP